MLLAWVAALTALGRSPCDVDVRVPLFLHRLVMTPQVHRVHHGQEVELALANYANVFPVWDVLFGTFRDPARGQPARFGIEDDRMPTSFWRQIAAPFAWRRLVADGQTEAVAPSSTCGAPS